MSEKYFDIKRDLTFPCFCQACLVGKTETEMSKKDVRYCVGCQVVIEEDYQVMADHKYKPLSSFYKPVLAGEKAGHIEIYRDEEKTKMSTLNQNIATMDNLEARGRPTTYKKLPLPNDKIKQLHKKEGMGARAIAGLLKREHSIDVSYKTIQRVLSGQRN